MIKSALFKNISWLFFDKIFRMLYGIFVSVLLARYLGPADFGQLNFSIAFVYVFLIISNLGLESVLMRELTLNPDKQSQLVSTSLFMRGAAAFLLYGLCVLSAVYFNPEVDTALLIVVIGTQLLFQVTDVFFAVFMADINSKYVVLARNIGFLVAGAVKILFVYLDYSLVWFALATTLEFLVCFVFISWFIKHKTKITLRLAYWDAKLAKKLLKSSYPLIISGVFYVVYTKLDQVMLGYLSTSTAVGYYAVAAKFSEVWYFIPTAIVNSFYPELVKLHRDNTKAFDKLILDLMTFLAAGALILSVFFTFFSNYFITLLYGETYQSAGTILMVHIWSCIIVFSAVVSGSWFVIKNLEKYSFYRTGAGALINIGLNIVLIPIYGALGAAISTLLAKLFASYLLNGVFFKTREIFFQQSKAYWNTLKIAPVLQATKTIVHEIRKH